MDNSNSAQTLEGLKKNLKEMSDQDISKIISHGAMLLSDEIAQTVSFAFWICYMAEHDLNNTLKEIWQTIKIDFPEYNNETLDGFIEKEYKLKVNKIDTTNKKYNPKEVTFGDLIGIKEILFGKTPFIKLLWKLKTIRNDLSHGRINNLKYNNKSLLLRETKEELIMDYFKLNFSQKDSLDISPIWKKLSEEDKANIEEKLKQNERQKIIL